MSADDEGPISRWSRLKRRTRVGEPAPEAPPTARKSGGAAPVAGRRLVRSMAPLAGAEQDVDDPYAAPPIVQAYGLPPEPVAVDETETAGDDENRDLTPEEQEAVKDLPPIDGLNKDSDFTPFLADKVPDFIRRKALSVLWRSDPVLANLDGLNDYDEDFTFAAVVAEALADAKETRKMAKAAKKQAAKEAKEKEEEEAAKADDDKPAEAAETAGAGDDVGDADGEEQETGRLPPDDPGDDPDDDPGEDLVRRPGTPTRRH